MADQDEMVERTSPPAVAEAEIAAPAAAADTDAVVDCWMEEYFPESTLTRDSAGWQLFSQAVVVLKQRLKGVSDE